MFPGNTNQITPTRNVFPEPVTARFVKFLPGDPNTRENDYSGSLAMRMAVLVVDVDRQFVTLNPSYSRCKSYSPSHSYGNHHNDALGYSYVP